MFDSSDKERKSASEILKGDSVLRELSSAVAAVEKRLGRTVGDDDLKAILAQVRRSSPEPTSLVSDAVEADTAAFASQRPLGGDGAVQGSGAPSLSDAARKVEMALTGGGPQVGVMMVGDAAEMVSAGLVSAGVEPNTVLVGDAAEMVAAALVGAGPEPGSMLVGQAAEMISSGLVGANVELPVGVPGSVAEGLVGSDPEIDRNIAEGLVGSDPEIVRNIAEGLVGSDPEIVRNIAEGLVGSDPEIVRNIAEGLVGVDPEIAGNAGRAGSFALVGAGPEPWVMLVGAAAESAAAGVAGLPG